jgi:hypothetical protein
VQVDVAASQRREQELFVEARGKLVERAEDALTERDTTA